jgi:Sulfotransferase family
MGEVSIARARTGTDRAIGHPPIFVVGCGRSGTTMLRLMLDTHPELAIPGEGHFIPFTHKILHRFVGPEGRLDTEALTHRLISTVHFRRWGVPDEMALRRVRALHDPDFPSIVEALYLSYADLTGKSRWGDKTPIYVQHIPLLAELFPAARFIHVIRDGHDVAMSYLSVPWGPSTIWEVAKKWSRDASTGRRAGGKLGPYRYLEIRYEELVAHSETVLKRLCSFGSLSFDRQMLDYHSNAGGRLQVRLASKKYHRSATKPVTAGIRDWRSQMPKSQIEAFEALAGDTLMEFGYELWRPTASRTRRAEAALRDKLLDLRVAGSRTKNRALRKWSGVSNLSSD